MVSDYLLGGIKFLMFHCSPWFQTLSVEGPAHGTREHVFMSLELLHVHKLHNDPMRRSYHCPHFKIKDLLSLGSLSNLAKVTTWWSEGLNPGGLGAPLESIL